MRKNHGQGKIVKHFNGMPLQKVIALSKYLLMISSSQESCF